MATPDLPLPLRPTPFPYRAILAICSDLDETPDREVYEETARFLNTTQTTTMGEGLGLEVGNTIYFDMAPDQFAYWNTDDRGRALVRAMIRSGHIDCFHSYGDLATSRQQAGRALDELARHDCRITVWIDHAIAPTNFGADIMRGTGDVPGAPAYHADLTCGFGVQYVWRGRVTSVVAQDVPRRLGGIFDPAHPLASARTLAKEMTKSGLARLGHEKYAMHPPNEVLRPARLRDGREVTEFIRANPFWLAVDKGETAEGLAGVLVRPMLERLMERGGVSILYTHLGKVRDRREPLGPATRAALSGLASLYREGRILVTTTRRLLDYRAAVRQATAVTRDVDGSQEVEITLPPQRSPEGLTVYLPRNEAARLRVNGRLVADARRNEPDLTGRSSLSVPWRRLEFPRL